MPAGLREASFRLGVGDPSLPAGGPLTVGSEVEKPDFPANDVTGSQDVISVVGDNRGNELATGQVNHRSPSKRTAASVTPESKTRQPVVVSEPIEAVFSDETHKSRIPEGIARFVRDQEETYQSRVSGQGAPSDSFAAPITPLRSGAPGPSAAGHSEVFGRLRTSTAAVPGRAVAGVDRGDQRGEPEGVDTASGEERPRPHDPGAPPTAVAFPESRVEEQLYHSPPVNGEPTAAGWNPGSTRTQSQSESQLQSPRLVIGRIDVVVIAKEQPANNPSGPAGRANTGFFSRNYLKRL